MNPTDKAEMQIEEVQDGSAIVQLPESEVQTISDDQNMPAEGQNDHSDEAETQNRVGDDDPDREQIREARREERRLKKQLHREKAKESNHLINALKKQNQQLAERLAIIEKKTSGAELARVDKAIEDAGVQVEYAKMKMQEAVSSRDGAGVTKAQEMWFEAQRQLESLQNVKKQATRPQTQSDQNLQIPDPMVQKRVADWMERNPWYDPNGKDLDSEITQRIDKKLTEEGYDPASEDYWDELDDRLEKYMPHKTNRVYNDPNVRNSNNPRPRSVMTSSGRETTANLKPNEMRISPDRVAAMKEAGLWDNPKLRQKAVQKYAEWDRQNKQRGQ